MNRNLDGRAMWVNYVVDHGKFFSFGFRVSRTQPAQKFPRYFSNIAIAGQDDKPACMWIDANGDQPTTAFQVHFPDFVMKEGELPRDTAL